MEAEASNMYCCVSVSHKGGKPLYASCRASDFRGLQKKRYYVIVFDLSRR